MSGRETEEIESINDAIFYTYFGFNNYDKT